MPPRYAYWTIVLDTGSRTSFRSATRNELVTTLRQMRRKDPKAELKWFAQGRLWESPTEAQAARVRRSTKFTKLARNPKEVMKRKGGPSRPGRTNGKHSRNR
ncbi:MAG: hypothetical protein QF507_01695 [Vicinamibacterales bacterium]|jgi:hypothetical protein|nr:hypothetical protein [Acidobacteriota bacterium]MDP7210461.1 hypothetical protein [Vicinamibacterales bacterium]|tara:strand:+ start:816 stop:1121 length:306 start_codon:yes stop_codon:yes gene_type:complete